METILGLFQTSFGYAVPVIVLLGLLIFVHELGHFLVAKYYKVRVEVFSLGFGPKILKFKKGDTVYAISAIPLGGYVKMFGDDPTAPISDEQKQFSFLNKPVRQRIGVVLAGPLMNFFFAIVLFMALAQLGEPALQPVVGDVEPTSFAYANGFRSGDRIQSVNGSAIKTWDSFQAEIEASGNMPMAIEVTREGGQKESISITPPLRKNKNPLSWKRMAGEIEGLSLASKASAVGVRDTLSLAAQAGFVNGDIITSINGEAVTRWRELDSALTKHIANSTELVFEVQRYGDDSETDKEKTRSGTPKSEDPKKVSLRLPVTDDLKSMKSSPTVTMGIEFPTLFLGGTGPKSPAAAAGLMKGDRLVAIDDTPVTNFEEVTKLIKSFDTRHKLSEDPSAPATPENALKVAWERRGQRMEALIKPDVKERMNSQYKEENTFEIGILSSRFEAAPMTFALVAQGFGETMARGWELTIKWTNVTVLGFVRLITGEVSRKNIAGFISIGAMAKASWEMGASQFVNVMAIISINLFVLNLLPVPVLDGGHLVFYMIELVRGAPISLRKMEIAQQVGMVLLLALMGLALFNDFSRFV